MGRGRSADTYTLIEAMQQILEEIQPCSVRAVAYQLFTRRLIPSMSTPHVQRVSRLLVIAREEGAIPWEWIVDSTRPVQRVATWADPPRFALAVQRSYRRSKWEAQPVHVMLWSEKATVEGTLQPVLDGFEVEFQVLHGWSGATPVYDAALASLKRQGRRTLILYVGDYDPSGMGMSEADLPKRLARYLSSDPSDKDWDADQIEDMLVRNRVEIRRIALTEADTLALGPAVSFPARDKRTDTRYGWFVERYGATCYELDAMNPNALRARVADAIEAELDPVTWARYLEAERVERESIMATTQTWRSILQPDQK